MVVAFVLLIVVILVAFYLFFTRNFKYWQKRGIPCPDGALPGVGHMWEAMMKTNFPGTYRKIYNFNRNHSMVGFYNFMTPSLVVREPALVKSVLQTSFVNFHENGHKIDPELDPLLANNPFFTYGDKWVTARKRLTYAFSSMRLKVLLETVKQACKKFEGYLDEKLSKTGRAEIELKNLFARFTAQVVSSAGFGVDGLCFDEKAKDSFYEMSKSVLESNVWSNIIFTITFCIPMLSKIFKLGFLPKKVQRFFKTVIADVLEQRRKEGTRGNDFLQLMADLEMIEGDKFELDVLTSHAVSFFLDGYETSSTALSFVTYQLATHPEVQKKLREEVVSVLKKYDGAITYEALKDMTYMDQVFNESQRIIPTVGFQHKICTEETELRGSDGLVCRVQPGMHIFISIWGLHKDSHYWENPEVFDPERFSPDRKNSIERFTHLPFGEGPRMCVGMRMAQLQIKACLATFLKKYSLELSPKTRLPLKITAPFFLSAVQDGLWSIIRPL